MNSKPICVNSKSGRGGHEGLQPSVQDRIYYSKGKAPAVTTSFHPFFAIRISKEENISGDYESTRGD